MNRSELIDEVAERAEISKAKADAAIRAMTEVITEQVSQRKKVSIPGFLTFDVSFRKARIARNPRTGEEVKVEETWAPKVTAGSGLKSAAAESE
jgi:nucleoid DNA-binding protein